MFEFKDFNLLTDGILDLVLVGKLPGNDQKGLVPVYKYDICLHKTSDPIGEIDIRIGHNENIYYGGNIGYAVDESFRGKSYASRACNLLKQVALGHGLESLIITCDPENWPSRRTCEKSGLILKEIVDLPEHNDMYLEGERQKCIFVWQR